MLITIRFSEQKKKSLDYLSKGLKLATICHRLRPSGVVPERAEVEAEFNKMSAT